jgi:hypothetical protein
MNAIHSLNAQQQKLYIAAWLKAAEQTPHWNAAKGL